MSDVETVVEHNKNIFVPDSDAVKEADIATKHWRLSAILGSVIIKLLLYNFQCSLAYKNYHLLS